MVETHFAAFIPLAIKEPRPRLSSLGILSPLAGDTGERCIVNSILKRSFYLVRLSNFPVDMCTFQLFRF